MKSTQADTISQLNDRCRRSIPHSQCYLTPGVISAFGDNLSPVLDAVRGFDAFTRDNDPYGENDFGKVVVAGISLFWKIDTYQDATLTHGADDPLSPQAVRVITIMRVEEY
ncbi:MAG: DUF3768 domain-containing protein [Vampirovibrionales bacterium]|nr:DUF3768 domain-containing protein [Vampirovibrionales bacterium]